MQIEWKLKRILPVLLGLTFLWAIFLLSRFLLEAKENPNRNYIPANSSLVVRMDGQRFLESAIYDLAYSSGDKDIFRQLQMMSERDPKRQKIRKAGIDFFSDVIFFSQDLYDREVFGFIFNLDDARSFNENMNAIILKNQGFSSNEEVGVLLMDPTRSIAQKDLMMEAEKLLKAPAKQPVYVQQWNSKNDYFLDIELPKNGMKSGSFHAKLNGSTLSLDGNFKDAAEKAFSPFTLKPEGFHLRNAMFNDALQRILIDVFKENGFQFPETAKISANYRGTSLANGIVPMADLLLEFRADIDPKQIFENAESWRKLGFSITGSDAAGLQLTNGDLEYTLKMLDSRTIFIGQHLENLLHVKDDHLLLLQGDLTKITTLEGAGFLGMGINLYPPYKSSRQFFESIESADVKVVPQGNQFMLRGKIEFRKGQYPVSETLKLILGLAQE